MSFSVNRPNYERIAWALSISAARNVASSDCDVWGAIMPARRFVRRGGCCRLSWFPRVPSRERERGRLGPPE